MGYTDYLNKTSLVNQRIDSLNIISMYLHDLRAKKDKRLGNKKMAKAALESIKKEMAAKTFEPQTDLKLRIAQQERDSIRISFIEHNMDKYAGQFLLTRIMKKLSPDSLRQFYRLIPVEMKKTKFARLISNQINPYADDCIRQADNQIGRASGRERVSDRV